MKKKERKADAVQRGNRDDGVLTGTTTCSNHDNSAVTVTILCSILDNSALTVKALR